MAVSHSPVIVVFLLMSAVVAVAEVDDGARLQRLDGLLEAGEAAEAAQLAAEYLEAGSVDPGNRWQFLQRLGVALLSSGQAEAAIPVLERALLEAMHQPALHLNLGRALRESGQRGRAIAEYQAAVNLAPDRYEWRLEYAEALLDLGIRRDALVEIEAARRICGDCPESVRGAVNFHLAANDLAGAVEPLLLLMQYEPSRATRQLLVQAMWEQQDVEAIVTLLDPVAEDDLTGAELAILLEVDRSLGRSERSRRWVEDGDAGVARVGYPAHHAWAMVAEILLADGQADAALTAIDRAIDERPDVALYHHNRAAILVALGRQDEARTALAEARRLDPSLGAAP